MTWGEEKEEEVMIRKLLEISFLQKRPCIYKLVFFTLLWSHNARVLWQCMAHAAQNGWHGFITSDMKIMWAGRMATGKGLERPHGGDKETPPPPSLPITSLDTPAFPGYVLRP